MATTKLGDVYPIIIDKYESFVPLNGGVDMIEKINSVVEHLNRLGQLTTETVNQWNKVMKWVNEEINGVNTYKTIPTFTNGQLSKVEEKDGLAVKSSSTLTYNSDGTVNTVSELINGKTVLSTFNYVNGEFSSIEKKVL